MTGRGTGFFINIPIAATCAFAAIRLLSTAETVTERIGVDKVGLALLVLWIGALQIMLDIGREHDWFQDIYIVGLAIFAAIGLAVFVIGSRQTDSRSWTYGCFAIAALRLPL